MVMKSDLNKSSLVDIVIRKVKTDAGIARGKTPLTL